MQGLACCIQVVQAAGAGPIIAQTAPQRAAVAQAAVDLIHAVAPATQTARLAVSALADALRPFSPPTTPRDLTRPDTLQQDADVPLPDFAGQSLDYNSEKASPAGMLLGEPALSSTRNTSVVSVLSFAKAKGTAPRKPPEMLISKRHHLVCNAT